MTSPYATAADLPSTLPVFPLAGAILLPRSTLPLNIFEPRYLRMIDDCLRGDRLIGIIQPASDGGSTGSPQARDATLREVGCAGRIISFQEMDDGRMQIALRGVARFRPRLELGSDKPYRTYRIGFEGFEGDLERGLGEGDVDRAHLLEQLKSFLAHRGLQADWTAVERAGTEQLVNWLSIASPFSPEERQGLLEAPTLAARADMLITLAEMELASGDSGGGRRIQ